MKDSKPSCTDLEAKQVVWLWSQMEALFPSRWLSRVGDAISEAGVVSKMGLLWVRRLGGFERADIEMALVWLPKYHKRWSLPELGVVLQLCEQARSKRVAEERYAKRIRDKAHMLELQEPTAEQRVVTLRHKIAAFSALGLVSLARDAERDLKGCLEG